MQMELPPDFPHSPPKGYSYEVRKFKRNLLAIWICNHSIFSYTSDTPKSIWGFYSTKTGDYYAPINATKCGDKVNLEDTRNYTAIQLNLNPLEAQLFT